MGVVDRSFDNLLKLEECAVMPLAGGVMGNGYQCGMLWGGALAAGAQAYRLYGSGPQAEAEAVIASQRLVESFRVRAREINCAEITEIEWKTTSKRQMATQVVKFFARGGPIGCFRLAADYAEVAFDEINTSLAEKHVQVPPHPASCAAMLAKKMGVSDMYAVMAAGLAGGIGLSGGACGALGVAIWIAGMNLLKNGGKLEFNAPHASDAIERFLKIADYEFECSRIVGRKFESIGDHASYLRDGGCSKIIEALATPVSDQLQND
jgi:hypothetical protein